jgi:plasmid stabilization system protein ParE
LTLLMVAWFVVYPLEATLACRGPVTGRHRAHCNLNMISQYTVDRWGETQANLYLAGFLQCFEHVEKMRGLGRACPDIHQASAACLDRRMLFKCEDFLLRFSESIE